MARLVALILMALAVACGRAAPDASPPAEPARATPAREIGNAVDSACDSLIAVGTRVLQIDVRRTDDREVENPYVRVERHLRPGCRVTAVDSTDRVPEPVYRIYQALEAGHWKPLLQYMADGQDGSVVGFLRGSVICVVSGHWHGGDDSDSTYVPEPGYEVEGVCFGAEPADTADGG